MSSVIRGRFFSTFAKNFLWPDLLMDSRSIVEMEMSDVVYGG